MGRVARACDSTCTTEKAGAPSLRFLQGRVRCCLYREIWRSQKPVLRAASCPSFAKSARRMGHPVQRGFEESKAGPPANSSGEEDMFETLEDKLENSRKPPSPGYPILIYG